MVWKSDFFSWFMKFVRVPPYENWAFWTNFYFSWENGEFFWGQTCCTLFHTKNEEKSQKISTCIRIHTRVYAITWWWGQICPPPGLIGLKEKNPNRHHEKNKTSPEMSCCCLSSATRPARCLRLATCWYSRIIFWYSRTIFKDNISVFNDSLNRRYPNFLLYLNNVISVQ